MWALAMFAQVPDQGRIASLQEQLRVSTNDSLRAAICMILTEEYIAEDYVKAADYAIRAVDFSSRTRDVILKFVALNVAGEVYLNAGQSNIAVDYFLMANEEVSNSGDTLRAAMAKFNLGSVWMVMGEFDKAEKLILGLLTVLEKSEKGKDELIAIDQLALYNNLVMLYNEQQQWDKSRVYFHQGVQLAGQQATTLLGQLYQNHSKGLSSSGNLTMAISLLDTALVIYRQVGDVAREADCLVDVARIREQLGESAAAIQLYNRAYALGEKTQNDYVIFYASQSLYRLYEKTNQVDSTLKYLTISNTTEKKLNELASREKLIGEELRWKYQEQQLEVKRVYQRSMWYGITLALVLLLMVLWLVYKKQRALKQSRLEKYALELSAEQLKLRNELLEAEVELKDKQLTTEVMYRIQNNELVKEMVQKLMKIQLMSAKESKEAIQTVVRGLEKTLEEKAWEDFELRFQQVHPGFYEKLQEAYPDLSLNDRRMCAFLKLNMTSKDISAITGQTINTIQVARWRLRKKLGLQESESALADFFSQF
jgi:tetratricopeptide (TPR) repeat protein